MVSQRALWMASCKAGQSFSLARSTNCTASPKPLAFKGQGDWNKGLAVFLDRVET